MEQRNSALVLGTIGIKAGAFLFFKEELRYEEKRYALQAQKKET